jgi:hypothetical protein
VTRVLTEKALASTLRIDLDLRRSSGDLPPTDVVVCRPRNDSHHAVRISSANTAGADPVTSEID